MYNLDKVSDNLYRGSAPLSFDDVKQLVDNWGIKRIVSLDEEVANKIHPFCEKLKIDQLLIPIDVNDNSADALMQIDLKQLFGNGPTFVHCLHGKDRTGLLIGLWRIQNGWPFKKALDEAKKFGFGIGLSKSVVKKYCKLLIDMAKQKNKNKNKNNSDVSDNNDYQEHYNVENFGGWFSAAPYENLGKFYPLDKVYRDQETEISGRNSINPLPKAKPYSIPDNGTLSPTNNIGTGPIIFMTGPLANN